MDKLLEMFIKEPEREFHVRELAKLLKKSPTTISKHLKSYESKCLLISNKKLNHLLFKANSESKKFVNRKLSFNLNSLYESGLIDYLIEEFNHPEAIVLFGSFSKAEDNKNSDIDLLIISPKKKEASIEKFEKKLNRKIQLFVHSQSELERIKNKNKELFNNWINGIVVHGYFEALR